MSVLAHFLIYCAAGVFAGMVAGLMGLGGGIVVVPTLIFLFTQNPAIPSTMIMPLAIGTSLTVMVFTSQSSIRAHYRQGNIFWPIYKSLAPGIAIGALFGAFLADKLPGEWLKSIFALFVVFIALKMLFEIQQAHLPFRGIPKTWINMLMSILMGTMSGLLGIGGGAFVIPYLNYCGLKMKKIAPISALCTLTVALVGSMTFILMGEQEAKSLPFSTGFVYWPAVLGIAIPSSFFAPVGAKLTYILPVRHLKYFFIVLLIATAIMLFK